MSKYLEEIKKLECHSKKYFRIYCELIEKRLVDPPKGYVEKHHILPRSLCFYEYQKTDKENLVNLTAREHFIAHVLLCKITKRIEMYNAYFLMHPNKKKKNNVKSRTSYTYEKMKQEHSILKSKSMSGENHFNYGKKHTAETKKKISNSLLGIRRTEDHKNAIKQGGLNRYKLNPNLKGPNFGKKNSIESNKKNSESNKKVIKTQEWNKKNSESNTGRIHIANTITKERKRPFAEEANNLISSSNGVWIKLATSKKIPDHSPVSSIISSILESDKSIDEEIEYLALTRCLNSFDDNI